MALAGSVLAATNVPGNRTFAVSLLIMIIIAVIGFVAALLIPTVPAKVEPAAQPSAAG